MSVACFQLHSKLNSSSKKLYMNPDQATHKKQVKIRVRYPSQVKRYMCIHATVVNRLEYTCPPTMCIQSIMCVIDQAGISLADRLWSVIECWQGMFHGTRRTVKAQTIVCLQKLTSDLPWFKRSDFFEETIVFCNLIKKIRVREKDKTLGLI